jgi:hypothetical protein
MKCTSLSQATSATEWGERAATSNKKQAQQLASVPSLPNRSSNNECGFLDKSLASTSFFGDKNSNEAAFRSTCGNRFLINSNLPAELLNSFPRENGFPKKNGSTDAVEIGNFMKCLLNEVGRVAYGKAVSNYVAASEIQKEIVGGNIGRNLPLDKKTWLVLSLYAVKEKIRAEKSIAPILAKHPKFKNFPVEDIWRMLINHSAWHEGAKGLAYDNNFAYLAGSIDGFGLTLMRHLEGKKIDGNMFREIHDYAVEIVLDETSIKKVLEVMNDFYFKAVAKFAQRPSRQSARQSPPRPLEYSKKEYRDQTWYAFFRLEMGNNMSERGLRDMLQTPLSSPPDFILSKNGMDPRYTALATSHLLKLEDCPNDIPQEAILVTRYSTPEKLQARADAIFKKCRETVEIAPNEKSKVLAIAECGQELERAHMFRDGNARTSIFFAINKLLWEAELMPSMISDPNKFDGFSKEELAVEIEHGQELFSKFAKLTD